MDKAEGSAGRVWWAFAQLLVLGLWRTLPTAGVLEVEMAGTTQRVFQNDNATIFCKVSGSPHVDIRIMGITWFRKSLASEREMKLFEFFGNHQEAFRSGAVVLPRRLMKGDASLQLPRVQLWEAGEYRCEVVITPQKALGRVWLEVVAYPVSRLFLDQAMMKGNQKKHISCTSSGFYPKDINITWKKWTWKKPQYLEFSEGVNTTPAVKNEDGTFNITSFLSLNPSLEDNVTIYQCEIWHISLPASQRLNFTLTMIDSERTTVLYIILSVIGSVLPIGLLLLILFWFLQKR
ncbi:natural cytotoxicity triggering receptor 3 ligand 1 isoform X1 [Manis javanica]|uniref:natural cytotoxicity triggering receptor 3 ligand 1 isoform X1 n=1 Tax=Manis javanica TaxID=9974 RepID=UPI00187A7AB3|nr:natural cytotoxicity triggering receptor 3 ligand 1 isoform X1 [Manis javanica]XP_036882747.1 natural cytotoxicity triggering receptor 3 ligand 1 isoform X1 [Manis javanica]